MHFFKRKLMYPSRRTEETSKEIDKLFKGYIAQLKSIQDSLPEGPRALSRLSFHDGTIKEVRHVSKREIHIVIESGGYDILSEKLLDYGKYTLSFLGVKRLGFLIRSSAIPGFMRRCVCLILQYLITRFSCIKMKSEFKLTIYN